LRRNWIKLYVDQTLRGSCFDELLPDERFVWFGFLLLAGDNACEGKISITEEIGYTNKQISKLLKCKKPLIERSIGKMIKVNKIKILKNNVIKIVNWRKYQSEYQRQKPYRDSNEKLLDEVTTGCYKESDRVERDREREGERDKEKKKNKKKYMDNVYLTEDEHKKLIDKFGKDKTDDYIESLNYYIGSKGKKYKSHYMTILNWDKMNKNKKGKIDWDKIKEEE